MNYDEIVKAYELEFKLRGDLAVKEGNQLEVIRHSVALVSLRECKNEPKQLPRFIGYLEKKHLRDEWEDRN